MENSVPTGNGACSSPATVTMSSAMLQLQQEFVAPQCIVSILMIAMVFGLHRGLTKWNPIYYGRSPFMDKLTVLMNLTFAGLYILVIVPFSIASARTVFLDVKEQTVRNAFSINLGLNTLAVLFLWEGVMVASLRPNLLLVFHHATFFAFILAFTLTQSPLILQVGLVLGCLTTWQIFPRITAVLRFLGIRRRFQKVVAFGSVVVGFITRLIMGPIALLKVVLNGYADLTSETSSQVTFGVTIIIIAMLLYMEFEGFVRHMKLYQKLKTLAAQSLLQLKKLSQSILRSKDRSRTSHPSERRKSTEASDDISSSGNTNVKSSKMRQSMIQSVAKIALEGGERYLQMIESQQQNATEALSQKKGS